MEIPRGAHEIRMQGRVPSLAGGLSEITISRYVLKVFEFPDGWREFRYVYEA